MRDGRPAWQCVRCGCEIDSDLAPGTDRGGVIRRSDGMHGMHPAYVRNRIAVLDGTGEGDDGIMDADCDVELVRGVMLS